MDECDKYKQELSLLIFAIREYGKHKIWPHPPDMGGYVPKTPSDNKLNKAILRAEQSIQCTKCGAPYGYGCEHILTKKGK